MTTGVKLLNEAERTLKGSTVLVEKYCHFGGEGQGVGHCILKQGQSIQPAGCIKPMKSCNLVLVHDGIYPDVTCQLPMAHLPILYDLG